MKEMNSNWITDTDYRYVMKLYMLLFIIIQVHLKTRPKLLHMYKASIIGIKILYHWKHNIIMFTTFIYI